MEVSCMVASLTLPAAILLTHTTCSHDGNVRSKKLIKSKGKQLESCTKSVFKILCFVVYLFANTQRDLDTGLLIGVVVRT